MSGYREEGTEAGLTLEADGMLRLEWPRGAVITEADAERAMLRVNQLCGEDRHPMLVDMATTADVSRGARAVFGRPCQVLANFFLGINAVPCPTKFFTSEQEAIAWLAVR